MSAYFFIEKQEEKNSPLFNMKYCSRCCMPETEEEYKDDEYGMCRICRNSEQKMHIDWTQRKTSLKTILENYKSEAGNNYDCIIPISGGKDSTFQLHILTRVFNMKPLAVTYNHNWYSKTGWYNLINALKSFNVDHIMFTPNRHLVGRIAKRSLEMIGDACWSCHAGVGSFPLLVATKFKVPLVIYGESIAENTQRGEFNQTIKYDKHYFTKISAKKTPDEMIDGSLSSKDLFIYQLPPDEECSNTQLKILHLGDYFFWDDERQTEFVRDNYFWKETEIENAFKCYKSAECIMPGLHDFTCYLKRGWGRATFHASLDVRNGILTREEGFRLISTIDPQRPEVLDYYLKITGLKESAFYETMEKLIAPPLQNQKIPVISGKERKNGERLIPFWEQLIEKHRGTEDTNTIQLHELCFSCGLELDPVTSECANCSGTLKTDARKNVWINEIKEHFEQITRTSGDNYDCIIPVDESWESAYLLHLLCKIYNLKPLAVTFNKYLISEIGWYNIINCLESFYVDHLMLTLNSKLAAKFQSKSKSDKGGKYFSEIGLYSFIIITAIKFNIPTIIGFHQVLKKFTKKDIKSAILKIDLPALQNAVKEITRAEINSRDIHLFNPANFDEQSVESLSLINAPDLFPFNIDAQALVKKYYGWKEDTCKKPVPYFDIFLEENKPTVTAPYLLTSEQKQTRRKIKYFSDIGDISATDIVQGYINKDFSPVEIAKQTIEKIERLDKRINAWEIFDAELCLKQAKKCETKIQKNGVTTILEGILVGVKDIFNTVDFPTQMGSSLWKGFNPGNDARAVFNIKRAGAIVCGKTVTSEFAVHALNKTVNPHDPKRTPGTSSSGSAAAVSTGMVPVALATQSGASIIRPASFCGIYGFKPSFGLIPRTGVLKTTDTLDNIGFFVGHAEDLSVVFNAIRLYGANYPMNQQGMNRSIERIKNNKKWKIAFVRTHTWDLAEEYAKTAILSLVEKINETTDFEIIETCLPSEMENAHAIHSVIYDYCLAYYFQEEFTHRNNLSEWLVEQIEHGKNITVSEYQKALQDQESLSLVMDNFFTRYDAMFTLSTAGAAPVRGEREKNDPGLMMTLTNLPSLNIPAFTSPGGLPFGLQLSSRRYADLLILEIVKKLISNEIIPKRSNPKCRI